MVAGDCFLGPRCFLCLAIASFVVANRRARLESKVHRIPARHLVDKFDEGLRPALLGPQKQYDQIARLYRRLDLCCAVDID